MAIQNIILKENAQFLKKETTGFLTLNRIKSIFAEASIDKTGHFLLNETQNYYDDFPNAIFSICVFKKMGYPSFIDAEIPGWEERKLGYLLLIEFEDFLIIFKKNVSGITDLLFDGANEISYKVLSTIFIGQDTNIEKVSLNNTNVLPNAMKTKILEADNLAKTMPTYGVSKYVPNSLRLKNNSEKTSVTFNTSRVNNYGNSKYIYDLIHWCNDVVVKIRDYRVTQTFLDVFAEPIEYADFHEQLVPKSILFNISRLHTDIEDETIVNFEYQNGAINKEISTGVMLKHLSPVYSISSEEVDGKNQYKIADRKLNDIEIHLNQKSITIRSNFLSNIKINFDDGSSQSIIRYLNHYNDFTINFENLDFIYYQRNLFKDSNLLNSIDGFLKVFFGKTFLNTVISEKGTYTDQSTAFTQNSIFYYVDTHVTNNAQFSFLDDLGDEWADFIQLKDNAISFIHAKHGTSQMSATDFQDVVGQALKNIGNFSPTFDRLDGHKRQGWERSYISKEGVATQINRLRKGGNIDDAIRTYKSYLKNPNIKREVILAVDFISKNQLTANLRRLRNGERFGDRNTVIQILWIISGLINCCIENGIDIYIHCKP